MNGCHYVDISFVLFVDISADDVLVLWEVFYRRQRLVDKSLVSCCYLLLPVVARIDSTAEGAMCPLG